MPASNSLKGKEVLVLEDDLLLSKAIDAHLSDIGMEVVLTQTCVDAELALQEMQFDFALFDLNLPDGESLRLLRERKLPENTLCILMTGEGGITSAVESIRLGAADYLCKPFDLDELALVFQHARAQIQNRRLKEHFKNEVKEKSSNLFFENSFAQDLSRLQNILSADQRLGSNLPPLLIEGPTGSGKSTYARWVHSNGPRSEAPFIALNCSAISENLVESELFGHEKGAFTDAKGARIGLFEAADRGTLFLDEVASLSIAAQAKLLLAIESGMIRRVGGSKDIAVDVRIIAAANQNLRNMIEEGNFREDLFHRLDLLRISIPPLASRAYDIPKLADHFLGSLAQKYSLEKPILSAESIEYLTNHGWPGNHRELLHELERAIVLHKPGETLKLTSSLPLRSGSDAQASNSDWLNPAFQFPENGFELEKELLRLVKLAIKQSDGNVSAAARLLGVPRDYIRYRLKQNGS
jgi:two-component system response regulator AtoC